MVFVSNNPSPEVLQPGAEGILRDFFETGSKLRGRDRYEQGTWEVLSHYLKSGVSYDDTFPGGVIVVQTFGRFMENPEPGFPKIVPYLIDFLIFCTYSNQRICFSPWRSWHLE